MKKYLDAVDRIISNLRESDYVDDYGRESVYGLQDYRLDMAVDIAETMLGRPLTEEELKEINEA